jgi:putative hemin transport protein
METQILTLKERWETFKKENPKTRIRNAASTLGVSEAELLATLCGGTVTKLNPDFKGILSRIGELGNVKAITRNDDVVHERVGQYKNGTFTSHVCLFVGEDIDLRIFLNQCKFAFAVQETYKDKPRYSLQFFAKDGLALHKIYLINQSDETAYHQIVKDFKNEEQNEQLDIILDEKKINELPDEEIDVKGFHDAWINLKDTHDFFGVTKKYKVTRSQALRLAPEGNYSTCVQNSALRHIFKAAVAKQVPIMVFVSNKGIIQIHTGTIRKIMDYEEWFNVLDPEFNLHLKESAISQSWIVRKPTSDGIVTSLEIFNTKNEVIATIFGKRKPNIPELESWRTIVENAEQELAI